MTDKPKRTLVIGDIHGGYKSLLQVLQRCNFSVKEDQLICLGDYVDGWSETAEVIQYLLELESQCVFKPIFLRGNHDAWSGIGFFGFKDFIFGEAGFGFDYSDCLGRSKNDVLFL